MGIESPCAGLPMCNMSTRKCYVHISYTKCTCGLPDIYTPLVPMARVCTHTENYVYITPNYIIRYILPFN